VVLESKLNMHVKQMCLLALMCLLATGGCHYGDETQSYSSSAIGDPIAGLTQAELDAFNRGRVVFERMFTPSEGLGPFYNVASCASCHGFPIAGGSAPRYRNFYMAAVGSPGTQIPFFDPILASQMPPPGVPPSFIIPSYAGTNGVRPRIPDPSDPSLFGAPVAVAQRNAASAFGVGQFEFVSDATIVSNSDPDDTDGDGISGRFNTVGGAIGRLGFKAQANNIETFTRGPFNNQLGITTDAFLGTAGVVSLGHGAPVQVASSLDDPIRDFDNVPDPELGTADLGDLIAFQRFLAPPPPSPHTAASLRGEVHFTNLGCVKCHIPTLPSSRGNLNAYTDLLLHDMGAGLADGISLGTPQASTIDPNHTANEFRTQPLWGVTLHAPFLHDGRADTLLDAVILHGGEAATIRDAFLALPAADQDDVIRFLEVL
jgi:CxxC motif-containing protein (DUF1111 family)